MPCSQVQIHILYPQALVPAMATLRRSSSSSSSSARPERQAQERRCPRDAAECQHERLPALRICRLVRREHKRTHEPRRNLHSGIGIDIVQTVPKRARTHTRTDRQAGRQAGRHADRQTGRQT